MMTTQTNDNQILLSGSDDSNSYYSDDSLFDESFDFVAQDFGDCVQDSEQQEQKPSIEVFLKPAKSRDDQYEAGPFPCSLLCHPYKYDVKVVGAIDLEQTLTLDMVDSETLEVMKMPSTAGNHNMKAVQSATALTIESVTKVKATEHIIRFAFNLCSFHVQRREFCLVVKSGDFPLYVSSGFRTYARRRDHHNYSRPAATPVVTAPPQVPQKTQPVMRSSPELAMVPPMHMFMYPQPTFAPQCTSPEMFSALGGQERTSLAIQLMNSLSPMERQTVNYYIQGCGAVVNTPYGYQTPYPMPVAPVRPVMVGGITTHQMSTTMSYSKSR